MRRALVVAALGLSLAACAPEASPSAPRAEVNGDIGVPGNFYNITVDGKPCIVWIHEYGGVDSQDSFSGLSCDWSPR